MLNTDEKEEGDKDVLGEHTVTHPSRDGLSGIGSEDEYDDGVELHRASSEAYLQELKASMVALFTLRNGNGDATHQFV